MLILSIEIDMEIEMRTYNNLINRAENGESVMPNLKKALEFERKQLEKMDLSGFISPLNYASYGDYEAKKNETRQAHIETVADAKRNIPILETAITKLGGITNPEKPKYHFNGYAGNENVNDGNGFG